MATADYWSSADLKALPVGGMINEEVMQQIIDIIDVDLPLTDRISSDSTGNEYFSWPQYTYDPPNLANKAVDGEDAAQNDVKGSARVGNHTQISKKVVQVTTRARQSNTIGYSDAFAEQLMRQTEQLRRDVEAISLSNQASLPDDGDTVAGQTGGLNAWLETNTSRGAGGADGGFNTGTGIVDAAVPGTVRALSETAIRDICQSVYEQGFDSKLLMSSPAVIRRLSEYFFTDTARVGIQQTETGKGGASTAVGSVKVFITDFDVELMFTANRLQQEITTGNESLFILDPQYIRHTFLHGYRTEPLAKLGLADRSQVAVDWGLKVLAEQAQGVVADIDPTAAMVA